MPRNPAATQACAIAIQRGRAGDVQLLAEHYLAAADVEADRTTRVECRLQLSGAGTAGTAIAEHDGIVEDRHGWGHAIECRLCREHVVCAADGSGHGWQLHRTFSSLPTLGVADRHETPASPQFAAAHHHGLLTFCDNAARARCAAQQSGAFSTVEILHENPDFADRA